MIFSLRELRILLGLRFFILDAILNADTKHVLETELQLHQAWGFWEFICF